MLAHWAIKRLADGVNCCWWLNNYWRAKNVHEHLGRWCSGQGLAAPLPTSFVDVTIHLHGKAVSILVVTSLPMYTVQFQRCTPVVYSSNHLGMSTGMLKLDRHVSETWSLWRVRFCPSRYDWKWWHNIFSLLYSVYGLHLWSHAAFLHHPLAKGLCPI